MLDTDPGIEIAGEAGTAADALRGIAATRPHVAVLDVRLPDGSGIEVCREVRSRDESVHCLMLTSYADDEALLASVMAGASGYVLKELSRQELLRAVHQVADGTSLLDPADTQRLLDRLHLAEKTVKNYVSGLLAKLGMERRSQAAAYIARLQASDGPADHHH